MNKKRAFTMVELIFVIVILGILAAVAVPKLNASREDAKAIKMVTDMRTFLSDAHSYYAANGHLERDPSKFSNVQFDKAAASGYTLYRDPDGVECFRLFVGSDEYKSNSHVDGDNQIVFYTRSSEDSARSSACLAAVAKMDFIVGIDAHVKNGKIVSLKDATQSYLLEATSGTKYAGVIVVFDGGEVNFE